MGTAKSKHSDESGNVKLEKRLHEAVLSQFKRMTDNKPYLCFESFKSFSSRYLEDRFQEAVFQTLKKLRQEDRVTSENVLRFAQLVFGSEDQLASCIILFDLSLRTVVELVVASLFRCEFSEVNPAPVGLLVDYIMGDAPKDDSDLCLLSKWLAQSALFSAIISRVFQTTFAGLDFSLVPKLSRPTVLSPSALLAICFQLPAEIRYQWSLLYSSQEHGESFSKLLNAVNGAGPCLIVVETEKGRVFGGFANEGFLCGPQHSGDSRCFLFQDRLKLTIHNATGFNENYAYLNHQQASFPNGLGIGGEQEHWSFFLHEEFGLGTSSPSISTFDKCWLAKETRFKTKVVEAWRIGSEKERKRYDNSGNEVIEKEISALDRDPEAKAILELSGRKTYGDAFRELPQED